MFREGQRDPRLPKPYRNCWKSKRFRRRYDQVYMQILREGRYGSLERERQSASRQLIRRIFPTKCYQCGRNARRYAIRRATIQGKEVWATVRWCGKCQ